MSAELRARVLSIPRRWVIYKNVVMNLDNPYDCRTSEWKEFVDLLLTSSFSSETMGVYLHPDVVERERGYPPDPSIFENYRYIQDAIDLIIASPCCLEVEHRAAGLLFAKFKPVCESLPHILDSFNHPPSGILESRYPINNYITTLRIRFKDLQISVELHRHS